MHLSEIASQAPGRNAVIMADSSRAMTFAELDRRSLQVSRLLGGLGVQPGGHVALTLANLPEYFEIAWGAQRRGTLWTPVNWHLTAQEARYIVEDCGARVLFASPETADVAAQIAGRLPGITVFQSGAERPGIGLAIYERARDELSSDRLGDEVEGVYPAGGLPPRPGLAEELIAHCRSRLASFKCPRTIEFVAELPRLPTGKLLPRHLRDQRQPA